MYAGSARFEVLRRIGAGAMGVVYEAIDRQHDRRVALKILKRLDADAVLRFKHEFRALVGVRHRNLVGLHDLVHEAGQWLLTMELIEGSDLRQWLRGDDPPPPREPARRPAAPRRIRSSRLAMVREARLALQRFARPPLGTLLRNRRRTPPTRRGDDIQRLRGSFVQLAEGLLALHAAGKVHRDLKPSNVRVQPDGRVVILDFGLVRDLDAERRSTTGIVGTVAYMAPEQAAGRPAGPPADWYALGVMLYEALVGAPPFDGNPYKVLQDKQFRVPAAPHDVRASVPRDLSELAEALLAIDPAARPTGSAVAAALGATVEREPTTARRVGAFVGRARELFALRAAWEQTRRGRTQLVLIEGPSGVGKSALAAQLARELGGDLPELVVLHGRYFEREAVPLRALDTVVDELGRTLRRLPPATVAAFLPTDYPLLATLFPALRGLERSTASGVLRGVAAPTDPQVLRQRLHAALRELLQRLAQRRPVVIVLDDLQWADADSRAIFADALRGPDGPPLLVVATVRTADEDPERVARLLGELFRIGPLRQVSLGPLPDEEARGLVERLWPTDEALPAATVGVIAAEASGHPLFLEMLVRQARLLGADAAKRLKLEDALRVQIEGLSPPARLLLELLTVSGGPLPLVVAQAAARGLGGALVVEPAELRDAGLARSARVREHDAVEILHDRVRDVVHRALDQSRRRALHLALATAYEAHDEVEPETIYAHLVGADAARRAAPFAAAAARRAADQLQFDRAARLYRRALELDPESSASAELRLQHAEALANAGRGAEAAQAFVVAAQGQDPISSRRLRRRAGEQLLRTGHIDEGLTMLGEVLAAVGFSMPATPKRALARLLWNRARVRLRGLAFERRDAASLDAGELERIDVCWSVAGGLAMVDTIRAAVFQSEHLRLALAAGEPFRVCRALALEAAFAASNGGEESTRSSELLTRAEALAGESGDPYATAWTLGNRGAAAALLGRWREAVERCAAAEEIMRRECTGCTWELATFQFFHLHALAYLGDLQTLAEWVPASVRSAEARGDLYGALCHRSGLATLVSLASDQPEIGRAALQEAMAPWSQRAFHVEHFWQLLAETQIDLYVGDVAAADARLAAARRPLDASLLLRVQLTRIEMTSLRGRVALAGARAGGADRLDRLATAERAAEQIAEEQMAWALPLSELLRAGVASCRGRLEQAAAHAAKARRDALAHDMRLVAEAASYVEGLARGAEGEPAVQAAAEWLHAAGVEQPRRMVRMLAPGFLAPIGDPG